MISTVQSLSDRSEEAHEDRRDNTHGLHISRDIEYEIEIGHMKIFYCVMFIIPWSGERSAREIGRSRLTRENVVLSIKTDNASGYLTGVGAGKV